MFGTHKRYNLARTAYSRSGSDMYITEDFYRRGLLKLGSQFSAEMISETDFLFDIELLVSGLSAEYEYRADEKSLVIYKDEAEIEFCFTSGKQTRIRGHNAGLSLRLSSAKDGSALALQGFSEGEAVFGVYGKLFFEMLEGAFLADIAFDCVKGEYSAARFLLLPNAKTGSFEAVIFDNMEEKPITAGGYTEFDEEKNRNCLEFAEWFSKYGEVGERYRETARYAAWTVWTMRMKGGQIKEPLIFLHKQWAILAASWQQSYNAMCLQRDPNEAFRLICSMFRYQDEFGRLPGMLTYNSYTGTVTGAQPPFQGFALDFLFRHIGDSFISAKSAAEMYPKFAGLANYWTTYRSAGLGDDQTELLSVHESGWDDATCFIEGFPARDPGNLAFLVLLFEAVAKLAGLAGIQKEAEGWYLRAKKLTDTIVSDYWDGDQFVTIVKGKKVRSLSLASFQPIILGKRLPQYIIDTVTERLTVEGEWLTEIGLASESMKSPHVTFGLSFVSGRVTAPQNMIITVGLKAAGKDREASMIAARFCDKVRDEGIILGFAPYDYYPLTGEKADIQIPPVATDGWPWSSWSANCFLTMAGYII